jgi:hypothetical protein
MLHVKCFDKIFNINALSILFLQVNNDLKVIMNAKSFLSHPSI